MIGSTGIDGADMASLITQAPPLAVLVAVVVYFLRFMRDRDTAASERDERFLGAMQVMITDVQRMADRNETIGRETVAVMGQATEALRRIDADIFAMAKNSKASEETR